MLGVGLLISKVLSTQQQAMVTSFFVIMPAITFSGFGFHNSTMPQWLHSRGFKLSSSLVLKVIAR